MQNTAFCSSMIHNTSSRLSLQTGLIFCTFPVYGRDLHFLNFQCFCENGLHFKREYRDVKGFIQLDRCIVQLKSRVTGAHQQVSLARSPPLKDEEGQCVRLLLTSYDRTLVVKEISSEEVEEMHNILSEYHQVGLTQAGSQKHYFF